MVVDDAYVGYGLKFYRFFALPLMQAGYLEGGLGRSAITNPRALAWSRKNNAIFMGIIPKSLKVTKLGTVVEDVVCYFPSKQKAVRSRGGSNSIFDMALNSGIFHLSVV